jgi:hypothetical protein
MMVHDDRLKELFHACWGQAKASPEYDKQQWKDLTSRIEALGIILSAHDCNLTKCTRVS